MFNSLPAIRGLSTAEPCYDFSGFFKTLATSTTDLQNMLGIRGQAGTDIAEDFSHFYNARQYTATLIKDEGKHPTQSALADMGGDGTVTTDPKIGGGVREILHHSAVTDWDSVSYVAEIIPEPGDATKSFCVGGIVTVEDYSGTEVIKLLFSQWKPNNPGWYVYHHKEDPSGTVTLRFSLQEVGGLTHTISIQPPPVGEPFAFLCVYEEAANKLKIMTSVPNSYAETLITTPVAAITTTITNISVGNTDPTFWNFIDGFVGDWAQVFSFQWDATIDSEISEDNMCRWLQYMDRDLVFSEVGELWEIPALPHALDDEFENSVLDPAWDVGAAYDYATAIDPYATSVSPARVNIHGTHPSWLMGQNGISFSKEFPGGLPTNCLIWARMRWNRDLSEANGESEIALWFGGSSGGEYDGLNQIGVYMSEWAAGEYATGYYRSGGSFPRWGGATVAMQNEGTAIEYVAVHKLGDVYHGWVMGNGGNRFYLGSVSPGNAPSMDRVGFQMIGSLNSPGKLIAGIDFFRVVETATFLP
jgi:hypothetical protein